MCLYVWIDQDVHLCEDQIVVYICDCVCVTFTEYELFEI